MKQYTVKVPYVGFLHATEWHPTESTGPFSVLTRGIFGTEDGAITWAKKNLNGTPYSICEILL